MIFLSLRKLLLALTKKRIKLEIAVEGFWEEVRKLIKGFLNSSEDSDEICNGLTYQYIDFLRRTLCLKAEKLVRSITVRREFRVWVCPHIAAVPELVKGSGKTCPHSPPSKGGAERCCTGPPQGRKSKLSPPSMIALPPNPRLFSHPLLLKGSI